MRQNKSAITAKHLRVFGFGAAIAVTWILCRSCIAAEGASSKSSGAKESDRSIMVAGKAYRVSPGEAPHTWEVRWGNETMLWQPRPWMEDSYKEQGPKLLMQWTKPGLPYPWELPIEKRHQLSASEYMDHCSTTMVAAPGNTNEWDNYKVVIYRPDGSVRETGEGLEFDSNFYGGANSEYSPSGLAGKLRELYVWESVGPEEVRGQGGVTTIWEDSARAPQDTLYLPTVQKVRRLAGAVSKQYFPGSLYRYEDVSHARALPELNYKVVGFELSKPDPKWRGYGPNDLPNVKRLDPQGEVNVVLEITPKPGISWWYSKRYYHCGLFTMTFEWSEEYDAKGQLIRKLTHNEVNGDAPQVHMAGPRGPAAPSWMLLWGADFVQDYLGGFIMDGWVVNGGFNAPTSPAIFQEPTLYSQPQTLGVWLNR